MRQIWSWNIKRLYELMKLTRSKVQEWYRVQGQKMWKYSSSSRIMKHQGRDELAKVDYERYDLAKQQMQRQTRSEVQGQKMRRYSSSSRI